MDVVGYLCTVWHATASHGTLARQCSIGQHLQGSQVSHTLGGYRQQAAVLMAEAQAPAARPRVFFTLCMLLVCSDSFYRCPDQPSLEQIILLPVVNGRQRNAHSRFMLCLSK
jgi:hypothetical protein